MASEVSVKDAGRLEAAGAAAAENEVKIAGPRIMAAKAAALAAMGARQLSAAQVRKKLRQHLAIKEVTSYPLSMDVTIYKMIRAAEKLHSAAVAAEAALRAREDAPEPEIERAHRDTWIMAQILDIARREFVRRACDGQCKDDRQLQALLAALNAVPARSPEERRLRQRIYRRRRQYRDYIWEDVRRGVLDY